MRYIKAVLLFSMVGLAINANASRPYINLNIGAGLTKIGKTQDYSPYPGLDNRYDADAKSRIAAPIISIGLGYQFDFSSNLYASLGVEGDYIDYGDSEGIEHPGINILPNLDTLSYSYSAESYLLMLKGRIGFTNHAWFPYISMGAGLSFNNLGSYAVAPNRILAPPKSLYERHIQEDAAYSVGIGLYQCELNKYTKLSIGYRFVYTGRGSLKNPISGDDSIYSGSLSGNFIILSLKFS